MVKRNPKQRSHITRRLPGGDDRWAVRDYTKRVGEVVWAWNELHEAYALAFVHMVNPANILMGMTLWTALSNDTVQRNAVDAAVTAAMGLTSRQRASLRWALKKTTELTQYRNDVVHGFTGWLLTDKGTRVHLSHFGNPIPRLMRYIAREDEDGEIHEGPDMHKLARALRGDLMLLAGYVLAVSRSIAAAPPQQLPRRPRLQLPRYVRAASGQKPHRRRGTRRRHRQKPSPP